jgi:hypothetical protein
MSGADTKTLVAVVYDRASGQARLIHRALSLQSGPVSLESELLAEAEEIAKGDPSITAGTWRTICLELTDDEAGRLVGIDLQGGGPIMLPTGDTQPPK